MAYDFSKLDEQAVRAADAAIEGVGALTPGMRKDLVLIVVSAYLDALPEAKRMWAIRGEPAEFTAIFREKVHATYATVGHEVAVPVEIREVRS